MNDMQREIFNNILNSSTRDEIEALKSALLISAKERRAIYGQLKPNFEEFLIISSVLFNYSTNDVLNIARTNVNNILNKEEITLKDSINLVKNIYDIFTCIISNDEANKYQELQDKYNALIKKFLDNDKLKEYENLNFRSSILPNILRHPISIYMAQVNTALKDDERVEELENFIDALPHILKGTKVSKNLSTLEHINFFINIEYLIGSEKTRQFEINILDLALNQQATILTNLEISEILNCTQWTSLEGKALAKYSNLVVNSCALDDVVLFDSTFLPSYCGQVWIVAKFRQLFTKRGRMAKTIRKILLEPSKTKNLNDLMHSYIE